MYVPSEEKVYFFFSEIGKEYDFIEKFTVSRVAQVCTVSIVFDSFLVYVNMFTLECLQSSNSNKRFV